MQCKLFSTRTNLGQEKRKTGIGSDKRRTEKTWDRKNVVQNLRRAGTWERTNLGQRPE